MSHNGAKDRPTNDGGQQQRRDQCNGIRQQKASNVNDMADWAKREEIAKRKNLRLKQVSKSLMAFDIP